MRRIFIALIAGGLLLVTGVAASAKLEGSTAQNGQQGQYGQQQSQAQNDKAVTKTVVKPADKPAAPETKPATTAPKPATTATKPAAITDSQCGFQGEQTGEHDDAACNDQKGQAGANESKSEANDKADLPEKDNNQQGDNQD